MRFVSQQVNESLGQAISPKANFGLCFNKWLDYQYDQGKPVPSVIKNRSPLVKQAQRASSSAAEILKLHHARQAEYCQAMEQAGWKVFVFTGRLISPFVSGLGAAHPTETGMVLDHTSGMPYIPAASQKGVLRIAHAINTLQDDDGNWISREDLQSRGIVDMDMNWIEDDESVTLFGKGGNNDSLAGQMIILDSYPLEPPKLGEDILNPHYRDYYEGNRGPTEDQSPVPVRFLVVKPGAEFMFRILLRFPYGKAPCQEQEKLARRVEENIRQAITEVGMGAKTALGFGRFRVEKKGEPDFMGTWVDNFHQRRMESEKKARQRIIDLQFPWRSVLRRLDNINDWGALKNQVFQKDDFSRFQSEKEVGLAVAETAARVATRHQKKWTEDRDRSIAEWLRPSGVTWKSRAGKGKKSQPQETATDTQLLQRIKKFSDQKEEGWQQFKDARIKPAKLDRQCAEALKEKFISWRLKRSKKNEERRAFNSLVKRLKVLQ